MTLGNAAEIAGWGADVIVSGSAIYDGVDPARHLDLMIGELSRPMKEALDGKR